MSFIFYTAGKFYPSFSFHVEIHWNKIYVDVYKTKCQIMKDMYQVDSVVSYSFAGIVLKPFRYTV